MKIALIGDSHFGVRNDSPYFMEQQAEYFKDYFFPYLKLNEIKDVIHLGDIFDKRKQINFVSLRHTISNFINPIIENGINFHFIVGNHDSYFKSSSELISAKLLFESIPNNNFKIYDKIEEVMFDSRRFLMVPWIFPNEQEEAKEKISLSPADVVCGHIELNGIAFEGSSISRKGLSPDLFAHFDHTFFGHFHKPSQFYVGSPYQMRWSDYGEKKRIIVYDTESNKQESVYFDNEVFIKLTYPGDNLDNYSLTNKIVRIIVKEKDSIQDFEEYIRKIEEMSPYDIDIKEEYLYLNVIGDVEDTDNKSTIDIILESIDMITNISPGEKLVVKEIMNRLYEKAIKL